MILSLFAPAIDVTGTGEIANSAATSEQDRFTRVCGFFLY